jgi:hypothetical protein
MKVETYEATVENGQIKLVDNVRLPEHSKVFVVVPGETEAHTFHVGSPGLAQPEQAADFVKHVAEDGSHAGIF